MISDHFESLIQFLAAKIALSPTYKGDNLSNYVLIDD